MELIDDKKESNKNDTTQSSKRKGLDGKLNSSTLFLYKQYAIENDDRPIEDKLDDYFNNVSLE